MDCCGFLLVSFQLSSPANSIVLNTHLKEPTVRYQYFLFIHVVILRNTCSLIFHEKTYLQLKANVIYNSSSVSFSGVIKLINYLICKSSHQSIAGNNCQMTNPFKNFNRYHVRFRNTVSPPYNDFRYKSKFFGTLI